jgi:hypothetical protein
VAGIGWYLFLDLPQIKGSRDDILNLVKRDDILNLVKRDDILNLVKRVDILTRIKRVDILTRIKIIATMPLSVRRTYGFWFTSEMKGREELGTLNNRQQRGD